VDEDEYVVLMDGGSIPPTSTDGLNVDGYRPLIRTTNNLRLNRLPVLLFAAIVIVVRRSLGTGQTGVRSSLAAPAGSFVTRPTGPPESGAGERIDGEPVVIAGVVQW
jgi:hypothetical protein